MLFPDQRLLFIHIPKTGGNFLSQALLPISGDRIKATGHQDGADRFDIVGPVTRRKHMTLGRYVESLGDAAASYQVVAVYRPPVERLISLWFSPHRWMREDAEGNWHAPKPEEIYFNPDAFAEMLDSARSAWQMLDGDNLTTMPKSGQLGRHACGCSVRLLDFNHFQDETTALLSSLGLTAAALPERRVNAGVAAPSQVMTDADRETARQMVMDSRHRRDNRLFGRQRA